MLISVSARARHNRPRCLALVILLVTILFFGLSAAYGYSVLAHEAIIDSAWDKIRASILKRFPAATPDQLRDAHAYAYGGSLIQDLGYYPHGSHFFSDLTHYVRSGEFVEALIRDSQNIDEYAFALGALAHYAADDNGHQAVNRAVPMLYPHLARKYGAYVTYEDDPVAHLKTEFGFDVLEVAKGHYAPDAYRDFIGFEVAKPLLERAFQDTYCFPLKSVFSDLDRAINSYRYTVHSTIPKAVKIAWVLKKDDIQRGQPGITRKKFLYTMSRATYRKRWGENYDKPGEGTKVAAFFIKLIPKVGPLKALSLRMPTPQTEAMFRDSFDKAFDQYQHLLADEREGHLTLRDRNFDTGALTKPGAYFMADRAYARLVDDLAKSHFQIISPDVKSNILAYYQDPTAPIVTKKNRKDWNRLNAELNELRGAPPSVAGASIVTPPPQ
ncbi:MAG TPA: zinc dependent phospholipase C family protein [Candidatus Acidoferrales bacterium]|nr:zinc dependent phospholipase C family protein [Candidatus Acidoferrales bacterium]